MKIILLKDVEKLGKTGDVINAKDGFVRNFLVPKGLCTPATESALSGLKLAKEALMKKQQKDTEAATGLAKRLETISCTVAVNAGEDKLYGSVTSQDIADVLKQEGVEVDKKDIIIDEPIDKLGVYKVRVKLHPEVEADLKVWVVKK